MFTPLNRQISPSLAQPLSASLLLHGLLLVWLVYPPNIRVLTPSSVAVGENGSALTHLYWTGAAAGNSAEQAPARHKLTWKNSQKHRRLAKPDASPEQATLPANMPAPAPAAPAGMPYGTLAGGPTSGDEIRPALPISATDPVVDPHDLPGHAEGSIIVEVTIDDRGTIVQKVVLQSLGPLIDNKVLAALESWRFRPATRNGVAIPSKQDVYYHFKPAA